MAVLMVVLLLTTLNNVSVLQDILSTLNNALVCGAEQYFYTITFACLLQILMSALCLVHVNKNVTLMGPTSAHVQKALYLKVTT